MRNSLLFLCLSFFSIKSFSQNTLYDLGTIQQIEINFTQANWDYQLDTAKAGSESYIMAATVSINGSTYDSVGVKYKGNSSYDAIYDKNPLHIALDEFKSQAYQGFTDIKLGNGYADPSQIREVLAYGVLKNYMDCPRANFAQVYINGVYIGLYSNAESINKDFCSERYNSSSNTFLKCNPIVTPGPTTKSNLKFKGVDSTVYFNFYEVKSDYGWNDLVALCDTVTNHPSSLHQVMDIDKLIWMLAFNNVLVNLDSYSGVFCQNYYLYKDNSDIYNPIVWDLNMAFGGFPYAGSGATGTAGLTIANMQQMSLALHSGDPNWPLINAILSNSSYKRMYVAHMRTMVNEIFTSNLYQTQATQLQNLVDTAMLNDTNKFFSYQQFQNGLTTNNTVGSYSVPGISVLMNARVSYLQSTPEFLAVPPSIAAVSSSNNAPNLNTAITISATVTNVDTNGVFLGYKFSKNEKFNKVRMYDDGLHNDGTAGDNIYACSVQMTNVVLLYYIYAENNAAARFSPERAEYEYYSLQCNLQVPTAGQLVINEFLAYNVADTTDENGNYSDWIELYNLTNDTLGLFGLYLSDSYTNPKKYAFPLTTLIYPASYLMIWADDKYSSGSSLHSNFKLSLNGERIILSAADSSILDSITYGPQTTDVSFGRCPNGTGQFSFISPATFNLSNCTTGIENAEQNENNILVFPNPASSFITIVSDNLLPNAMLKIENVLGQSILSKKAELRNKVEVSSWPSGIYFVHLGINTVKIVIEN
jgi:spore coat protein CotH